MSDTFAKIAREDRSVVPALWARRATLTVLGAVVVAALLNRFGQRPVERTAHAPAAAMTLTAPSDVRGGLLFQSRLDIRAVRAMQHPRIVLDPGWTEGMQVNSIEPQPTSEATRDGRVVLSYDTLQAGDVLRVWLQFQVNPTNVGHRSYAVELDDAERPVARLSPTLRSWP